MNVLFYVEPLTECDMPTWKAAWINFVSQMVSSLESANSQMQYCCVVGDGLADIARAKLPMCSVVVIHHVELVPRFGESALATALHWYRSPSERNLNAMAELLVNHLGGFNPDVCICFAPAPFLAVAFPGLPVLHFELGLVSRAPFPPAAYLDPLGMFNHSYPMQNKDELRSYSATGAEFDLVGKIRHVYLPRISQENPLAEMIKLALRDFSSAILVALQFSQFYGYDAHAKFPDQYDLVIQTLSSVPSGTAVVVVEHPQHQILQKETVDYLRSRYKNFIWFPEFREVPSASHYLFEYVDMVIAVSSSVGLQAMLWKKSLIVLGQSHLDIVADSHSLEDISLVMQEPYPVYKENVLAWYLSRYSMPFELLFNAGVFLSRLYKAKVCAETGDYRSYFDLPFADISQITSAYLEGGQIVSLTKKVDSPDEQISILNQAVAEREGQIASLIQVVGERDEQIADLTQVVSGREGQIASLTQVAVERDEQIAALLRTVIDIKNSKSWRVTRPLRFIRELVSILAIFTLELLAPVRKLLILPLQRVKFLRWYYILMRCPLFDQQWYFAHNPDVSYANINPLWHYLEHGWRENRRPGSAFDGEYYLARYPDIAGLDQPPLLHYWLHGRNEGRHMNLLLDLEWLQGDDIHAMKLPQQMRQEDGPLPVGGLMHPQGAVCISVIIPTYNRIKFLPGIIASWRNVHSCTAFYYEIIFSDDGSSDGSVEYLESVKDLPLRVLRNAHGGAASARNAAIRAACGERLLIIGDDIFPDKEILNVHVGLARQMGPKVAILGCVDWHDDLVVNHVMHHITEIGNEQFSYNRLKSGSYVDFRHFYTCNLSIDRRFLLEESVIFDERFDVAAFEDIELGYRLCLRGMMVFYTTQARGAHYHPYTVDGFCRRQTSSGRMAVVFSTIHPSVAQTLSIDVISRHACRSKKSSGQDALWQSRVDMLVRRCEEYERLVVALPKDVSTSIGQCLSLLYSRLFRAMYEYGVLDKLESHPNALAISMAYHFKDVWEDYWTLLAQNKEQSIDLNLDEIYNLAEALNTGNSADLFFGLEQHAVFDELMQIKSLAHIGHISVNSRIHWRRQFSRAIYCLFHDPRYLASRAKQAFIQVIDRRPTIDLPSTKCTSVERALPALVIEPCETNCEEMIAVFRAAFGDEALLYERIHENLLIPQLKDGSQGEPVMPSAAEATIFFWPTTLHAMPLRDQLLSAYMAIIENGLNVAVVSHDLALGQMVAIGALRDHMLFTRDVAEAVFTSTFENTSFRGKVLRLLPANGVIQEQKLDALMGVPVDIDDNGFFASRSQVAITSIRYKVPYLPLRAKTKSVVFVFPIFLAVGGVERNTIEIMRQLSSRFDFVLITMERLCPEQGSLAAQAIEVAAQVIEMPEIVRHGNYLRVLTRLKANWQPDLIWVCNGSPWFCDNAGAIRKIFHDVPIIDQEVYDTEQGWIARYGEAGIQSFDRFIAINKKIEERFRRDFAIDPTRVHLIYHAVDVARICRFKESLPNEANLRAKFGLPDGKQIFTFIGRLTPQKRPLEFLKLAKDRLEYGGEYFVLVGNGELLPEVKDFIRRNEITNVSCIPYIENIFELFVVSNGIIFTSAYEGLPIAMIEALAMAVPTFATDVGDIADVLAEYGGGAVVPVNYSSEYLYEAFLDWLGRRNEYATNLKGNEHAILERFSSENIAQQYAGCWEAAMKDYGRTVTCENFPKKDGHSKRQK